MEPHRSISFPEKGVGTLSFKYRERHFRVPARGNVSVPVDAQEDWLTVSYDAGEKPEFLLALKPDDLYALNLSNTAANDGTCKFLHRLSGLVNLNLGYSDVGDDGVKQLAALPNLRDLDLQATRITDASAATLSHLHPDRLVLSRTTITDAMVAALAHSDLKTIELTQDAITDRTFGSLRSMSHLKKAYLESTPITDAGFRKLAGMKSLRELDLRNDPHITDASVSVLSTLTGLKDLDVRRSGITAAGVQRLQNALPHCRINQKKDRPQFD